MFPGSQESPSIKQRGWRGSFLRFLPALWFFFYPCLLNWYCFPLSSHIFSLLSTCHWLSRPSSSLESSLLLVFQVPPRAGRLLHLTYQVLPTEANLWAELSTSQSILSPYLRPPGHEAYFHLLIHSAVQLRGQHFWPLHSLLLKVLSLAPWGQDLFLPSPFVKISFNIPIQF